MINFAHPFSAYVGLRTASSLLPSMYRYALKWDDGVMAYKVQYIDRKAPPACGFVSARRDLFMTFSCLHIQEHVLTLCEVKDTAITDLKDKPAPVTIPSLSDQHAALQNKFMVQCSEHHLVHSFLACDGESACWKGIRDKSRKELWDVPATYSCEANMTSLPPMFVCAGGVQLVSYTLVCDFRADCYEGSDEQFCWFPVCQGVERPCGSSPQCYTKDQSCDGLDDCINGVDEHSCDAKIIARLNSFSFKSPQPPPAILNFDGLGKFSVTNLTNGTSVCPETHFQCADNGYCLPVYTRCNDVADCRGREDEAECDSYTCAGFYRCRGSKVCLHPSQLCDGWPQCPQRDDELLCAVSCPLLCTCQGLAFTCLSSFPSHLYPQIRYLDAGGSGLTPSQLKGNIMLIHLSLHGCHLMHLSNLSLPNLRSADLRDNLLHNVTYAHLSEVRNLQVLKLAGNPLILVFTDTSQQHRVLNSLISLDLSSVPMEKLYPADLPGSHSLRHLNLSDCHVKHVQGEGFQSLAALRVLDLRGSEILQFPQVIFESLDDLQEVYTDNYKLCCPVTLPAGFDVSNCHAPFDELSSCESLLRSHMYRVFLSLFAAVGFFGNAGSLIFRACTQKESSKSGFSVLVSYLSVADLLMGLYLIIIGVADRVYQDRYLWMEESWKKSVGCQLAGFLSFTSSEVSASIICLITIDRFLVLRFPFSQLHFHRISAHLASILVFLCGFLLAVVPWFPMNKHWEFYSQNGICIPLPITRQDFPGHLYSFGIMIVLNLVLFILIAVGQASIYFSIRTNAMTDADVTRRSQDLRIARRLVSIAMSDFLCWFPIGMLGVLSVCDVVIPSEVNVGIAIFVLPFNSALNPFLYTLNVLMDRLQQHRENTLLCLLQKQAESF